MRALRQILHGCKKHHYVYFRDIKHFENVYRFGGFKTKLICRKCHHIENSKVDMMICRGPIDEIAYGKLKSLKSERQEPKELFEYQHKGNPHIWVIGKTPVKR